MSKTPPHHQITLTASEVAEFMFCAKAWQLKREGAQPQSPHLATGTAYHRQHGQRLAFAKNLQHIAWVLLVIGFLVLFFWLMR